MPPITDPNVLVGINTADDAAIYKMDDNLALVQTVDFFPPIVDDPFQFGAIAAANAVSDIYAMGGRPIIALNIVCFPHDLSRDILVEILKGGASKAAEAGFTIVGGHTIEDPEPKYGLAVTGVVRPGEQVTNASAQPGDALILTKPLGIGIITTAIKAAAASPEATEKAIALMSQLNKSASEVMLEIGVSAATDVTGFGLLGHLWEMALASRVSARVRLSRVPVIEEAWELVAQGLAPGGSRRNLKFLSDKVVWDDRISDDARLVLCDAQTSGGLLISVPRQKSARLQRTLERAGVMAANIGEVLAGESGKLQVVP